MLGRHVYRVSPLESGGWSVRKEGEATACATRASREEATRYAWKLAAQDEPSRVVVEEVGGVIADERLFGLDEAEALEREIGGDRSPPPAGTKPKP
jgi:hypothetical protein